MPKIALNKQSRLNIRKRLQTLSTHSDKRKHLAQASINRTLSLQCQPQTFIANLLLSHLQFHPRIKSPNLQTKAMIGRDPMEECKIIVRLLLQIMLHHSRFILKNNMLLSTVKSWQTINNRHNSCKSTCSNNNLNLLPRLVLTRRNPNL